MRVDCGDPDKNPDGLLEENDVETLLLVANVVVVVGRGVGLDKHPVCWICR